MTDLPKVESIYTDGACSGNPGPGGWGTVFYFDDGTVHELGGYESQTTNNRMELQAAIAGLELFAQIHPESPTTLYTDSEYVKNGITKWIKGWKRKQWKTSTGKAVLNRDLWQQLDDLNCQIQAQLGKPLIWQYVRGHAGVVGNERCDQIARSFTANRSAKLKQHQNLNLMLVNSNHRSLSKDAPKIFDESTPQGDCSQGIIGRFDLSPSSEQVISEQAMAVNVATAPIENGSDNLPREARVAQLRNVVDTLHMADEIAKQGYLITSSELADLMDVNASAVTSRGEYWAWRNWTVSRVKREGNQILWQLERID
ncbi:MAG: ribonuclease HI [Cyanobacteria bacterium P01_A01_bin.123]